MELGRAIAPDTFRLERTLNAPIERVWSYFADAEKRARWFTGGDTLTRKDQDFVFIFAHHRITNEKPPARWKQMESGEMPMNGRVLAFDPPRLLSITWGDGDEPVSEVRFELTPQGDQTLLVLTHIKIDSMNSLRDFAGGWTAHVQTLADVLDGKSTSPFWSHVVAAHDAYERSIT